MAARLEMYDGTFTDGLREMGRGGEYREGHQVPSRGMKSAMLLAVLLALAVALLGGCGRSAPTNPPPPDDAVATTKAPSADAPAQPKPAEADLTESQARELATRLANETWVAKKPLNASGEPVKMTFHPADWRAVELKDGRWNLSWPSGSRGPEARVSFAANGSDPKVDVSYAID